jgi:hypothetical protein
LLFHGATTKSRDAIGIIEAAAAGKIAWPYSSVEMRTRDKWILSEKLFEAQEIIFDGAAMVSNGACRVCKIRNNEAAPAVEETPEPETKETEMADTKELEAQLEQMKKELEEAKAKPAPTVEIPKELSDSITGLIEQNKTLSARLEKLENQPTEPVTTQPVRELDALPEYFVPTNRKSGIIGA